MILSDYISKRDKIVNTFLDEANINDDTVIRKFNLVSASLYNYLPDINYCQHESLFRKLLMHQQLSQLEQESFHPMDFVQYENLDRNIWDILKGTPSIICTFHTGSYRLINLFLLKNEVPYTLVISKNVIAAQGFTFRNLFSELLENKPKAEFKMIDAEDKGSGFQLLRELKNGRTLLVYIDGNSGSGLDTFHNNNHCKVKFLNQELFARKGVGFLSHAAQVPLLPVACYRKAIDDIRLSFFDPIYPNEQRDREAFSETATCKIYDILAKIVKQYPEQWEAWLYLYKFAHIINECKPVKVKKIPDPNTRFLLNTSLYGLFRIKEHSILFNKNNYMCYVVNNNIYNLLSESIAEPLSPGKMEEVIFNQLYENNVFNSI